MMVMKDIEKMATRDRMRVFMGNLGKLRKGLGTLPEGEVKVMP